MNRPSEQEAGVAYRLFRVDDRLLHGQVSLGWGRHLRATAYIIADDMAAADPDAEELYRFSAPEGEEVRVLSVAAVAVRDRELPPPERTVLLVRDLPAAARLLRSGCAGPVNLGGLHHRSGARLVLPYLYLTAEDEALLRELAEEGASFYAQDLPGNPRYGLSELLG